MVGSYVLKQKERGVVMGRGLAEAKLRGKRAKKKVMMLGSTVDVSGDWQGAFFHKGL